MSDIIISTINTYLRNDVIGLHLSIHKDLFYSLALSNRQIIGVSCMISHIDEISDLRRLYQDYF